MDLKVYFVINVVPATIMEVVVEMISAQLLGVFWASHFLKASGSGNFRENGCKRVFCKKNNNSFELILVLQNQENQMIPEISIVILKLSCSVIFTFFFISCKL